MIYEVSSDGTQAWPASRTIPIKDKAWQNVEKQTIEWLPKEVPVKEYVPSPIVKQTVDWLPKEAPVKEYVHSPVVHQPRS